MIGLQRGARAKTGHCRASDQSHPAWGRTSSRRHARPQTHRVLCKKTLENNTFYNSKYGIEQEIDFLEIKCFYPCHWHLFDS